MKQKLLIFLSITALFFAGCTKKENISTTTIKTQNKQIQKNELDFKVLNNTGKTIYVTCFSYIKKRYFNRWRWDKSPIYKLDPLQTALIDVDTIPDEEDRGDIFGYLAVFNTEEKAYEAIYELLKDEDKLDLDRISSLNKAQKTIIIDVEKYGFKKDLLTLEVDDEMYKKKDEIPELDFVVENKTGKTKFVTAFIYQNKDNVRNVWRYDKTNLIRLEHGQKAWIDVDTIVDPRNRSYVRGYLAIFEEHEEKMAREQIYELLEPRYKLNLSRIKDLKNKKISLEIEKYGIMGNAIDYTIKPARHLFKEDYSKTDEVHERNVMKQAPEPAAKFATEQKLPDYLPEHHTHEDPEAPGVKNEIIAEEEDKRKRKTSNYKLFG